MTEDLELELSPEPNPKRKAALARSEGMSPAKRKGIAQRAAMVRWHGDMPQATHEGVLKIGEAEIPCAVLADGTRLLSRIGFIRAIGRTGKPRGGRKYDKEFAIPVFLAPDNLKPFIPNDLDENYKPIRFRPLVGKPVIGYRAELLPHVCDIFMDARLAKALRPNQIPTANACRLLQKGFARIGITALIDEATGYQEVRERQALQAILDAYLSHQLAAWARRFPNEFYREMFRLRGWTWDELRHRKGKGAGPRVVGKYTNDFVYARLAPGILEELQRRNPPNERGQRRAKYHQWLTEDVGHPALAQHLHAVIGLMRVSDTWPDFLRLINRAFPRRTDLKELPLFNQAALPSATEQRSEQSLSVAQD